MASVMSAIDDIVASPVIVGRNMFLSLMVQEKLFLSKLKVGNEIGQLRLDQVVICGLQVNRYFLSRTQII